MGRIVITEEMLEMNDIDLMSYCEYRHPDLESKSNSGLLAYALMYDEKKFRHYIELMAKDPSKEIIAFYRKSSNEASIKGKEQIGTILDGALFFG